MSNKTTKYLIIILFALILTSAHAQIGSVVHSFSLPGKEPTGLTFDGEYLWSADTKNNVIYRVDQETGSVLDSIPGPTAALINGLTWDGSFLWCASNANKTLYKISAVNGSIKKTVQLQTSSPRGLAWDGEYMWYQDDFKRAIYKIDTTDAAYLDTLISPSHHNRGLTWDGSYFWSSDRDHNEIYMIDPRFGSVIMILPVPTEYAYGLAFDGEFLWNADLNTATIHKIAIQGSERYVLDQSLQANIRYSAKVTNVGSGVMDLKTYLACPFETEYQLLDDTLSFLSAPDDFITDVYNQRIAYYREHVQPGEEKLYQWSVPTTLYHIRYFLHPDSVGTIEDIPDSVIELYTKNGEKYDLSNPRIKLAAQEAIGDETNLYWQVRKIHDYVIEKIYYLNDSEWATAPGILINGHGSCSEYSFLFIALCRAVGIPARYEGGGHLRDDIPYEDRVFHRWQQVYFPNYGWVPIDCTWDDKETPRDQARYFGAASNQAFSTTLGGGGEYGLWWAYNVANSTGGANWERERLMEWLNYETSVELFVNHRVDHKINSFNYPNPFNSNTTIKYKLINRSGIQIKIFNQLGQLVFSTNEMSANIGWNAYRWSGTNNSSGSVASGKYFYSIEGDDFLKRGQMMLIR